MTSPRNPTRQRLVDAALELFARQGITETTTKQIAELAEVNEVTLFRQFGNKQGLVLAVIEESEIFSQFATSLMQQRVPATSPEQVLRQYANSYLQLLDNVPEMVRSIVGEAGKSPPENREALGKAIQQANQAVLSYFQQAGHPLDQETLASLINSTLLGYAVLEFSTESHGLWPNRQSFIDSLVQLVFSQPLAPAYPQPLADLPATLVHTIFQRAQKKGNKEAALVYLLFGAGISPAEITGLERIHYVSDRESQFLQITSGIVRQVPINQWILGKRYGSYQKNPLTQWLKSRKDNQSSLFVGNSQTPLAIADIQEIWQDLMMDLITPTGQPPTIHQAQDTWRVEMIMRGLTLADMQILTGLSREELTPYEQRAREKAALEQAISLDREK